ncbi:hypothetical protein SAY86_002213 [Trapa natans]|uniref:Uncharacterized protein n=1 Tax=Trapa natans TaxID=22666 RepID=A0AAN7QZC6_TRANT|nr:hypothetical protein SAY86_002213 [Trapa natans]
MKMKMPAICQTASILYPVSSKSHMKMRDFVVSAPRACSSCRDHRPYSCWWCCVEGKHQITVGLIFSLRSSYKSIGVNVGFLSICYSLGYRTDSHWDSGERKTTAFIPTRKRCVRGFVCR